MAVHRVTRTDKFSAGPGASHRHVETLCLDDGRRVPKMAAIQDIKAGIEQYYTNEHGQRAEVEVASRCTLCAAEYLRTNRDTTTRNNLLDLPNC